MSGTCDYYIVFGAAVRPDGRPSSALRARVAAALDSAAGNPVARFLVTGGQGRHGPPEARVMAELLAAAGVGAERIVLEDRATDTLDSAVRSAALLKQRDDARRVVACSSAYHVRRCRLLLRLAGIQAEGLAGQGDLAGLSLRLWLYHRLREALLLPFDGLLMFLPARRRAAERRLATPGRSLL